MEPRVRQESLSNLDEVATTYKGRVHLCTQLLDGSDQVRHDVWEEVLDKRIDCKLHVS